MHPEALQLQREALSLQRAALRWQLAGFALSAAFLYLFISERRRWRD